MDEMKVNEIIKKRREELGYSLRDLSEMVGVNSSTIMRWERGDIANMKRDKIASLAKALRISPAVIMGWEEPKEPEEDKFTVEVEAIFGKLSDNAKERILAYAQAIYDMQKGGDGNE